MVIHRIYGWKHFSTIPEDFLTFLKNSTVPMSYVIRSEKNTIFVSLEPWHFVLISQYTASNLKPPQIFDSKPLDFTISSLFAKIVWKSSLFFTLASNEMHYDMVLIDFHRKNIIFKNKVKLLMLTNPILIRVASY